MKIDEGWVPPTPAEKDERIAERQVAAQERVDGAKKRRKEREKARAEEAKRNIGLTARLRAWMEEKAKQRKERLIEDADNKRQRRAEQRQRGAVLGQ